MQGTPGAAMITLGVNGRTVEVSDGSTLLDAVRAAGVHLPTLCHHPHLPSQAVCRMCLVDVVGQARAVPACITPARAGDQVSTDHPDLERFRRADLELLLARHPNDCLHCEVDGACRLQTLVRETGLQERWEKVARGAPGESAHRLEDHTSPSILRDLAKCVECGLCVQACGAPGQQQYVIGFAGHGPGRIPVTIFDRPLAQTDCISCGQCTLVCPVGALVEQPHWHEVLQVLGARRRVSAVQVAPATRVTLGEEFGLAPGAVSTGRMIHALHRLGFDHVFDTNLAADLTIVEEGTELLGRLQAGGPLPLFTSCCPAWVNWVEIHRPDLLPHLSSARSPQQMHGALTKRGAFARSLGPAFEQGRDEPHVVSVMPCTAKKDEALRPGMRGDVDHVLTTRELARMIRARGIPFASLPDDGRFDDPLGASTGAAQLFGASGGVMEAMLRYALHCQGAPADGPLAWASLRGAQAGVKIADVPGVGRVAVCNGIASAQQLLQDPDGIGAYVAIEVMACVGGCLGGGGEPKTEVPDALLQRMHAIHALDAAAPLRISHQNPDVQRLYREELGTPGSEAAHALLHTGFGARRSRRELLLRFLDCVDRRDARSLQALLHPDAIWITASPHGEIRSAAAISRFLEETLPPRAYGPRFVRHRMAMPSDPEDLTVVTPTQEHCRFEIEASDAGADGQSLPRIRRIVRTVLPSVRGDADTGPAGSFSRV